MTEALCLSEGDDDLWFPSEHRDAQPDHPAILEAKAICLRCPLQQSCRDDAVRRGEPFGVWGALTRRERIDLNAADRRCEVSGCEEKTHRAQQLRCPEHQKEHRRNSKNANERKRRREQYQPPKDRTRT